MSNLTFYRAVAGSTTSSLKLETFDASTMLGIGIASKSTEPAESDDKYLHASTIFEIAYHQEIKIDFNHSFVGPIPLDGVVPVITNSPAGRHHAIVNTANLAAEDS